MSNVSEVQNFASVSIKTSQGYAQTNKQSISVVLSARVNYTD
jgi:hypothetical protein